MQLFVFISVCVVKISATGSSVRGLIQNRVKITGYEPCTATSRPYKGGPVDQCCGLNRFACGGGAKGALCNFVKDDRFHSEL